MEPNLLTATADDLQRLLSSNALTSRQLVLSYLAQIRRHDDYLKAVINTAPQDLLLRRADLLDDERKAGKVRSPLHGIPVLLKDNIATSPATGLDTTAGSFALVDSRPYENAVLVDKVSPNLPDVVPTVKALPANRRCAVESSWMLAQFCSEKPVYRWVSLTTPRYQVVSLMSPLGTVLVERLTLDLRVECHLWTGSVPICQGRNPPRRCVCRTQCRSFAT